MIKLNPYGLVLHLKEPNEVCKAFITRCRDLLSDLLFFFTLSTMRQGI